MSEQRLDRLTAIIAAMSAILLSAGACGKPDSGGAGGAMASRPVRIECPLTSDTIVIDSTYVPSHAVTTIPVAQQITHVPEFHDCQRMIVQGVSGLGYDSLVAIFAAKDIITLSQRIRVRGHGGPPRRPPGAQEAMSFPVPQPVGDTSEAFSFAELYSWGGTYEPLGIKPGFNCLYVFTIGGLLHDFMVTVKNESDCLTPLYTLARFHSSEIVHMKPLAITPVTFSGSAGAFAANDIPAVARWDWDPARKEQFIGMRCGMSWCNIGSTGSLSAETMPDPGPFDPVPGYAVSANERERVWKVKGWQDYQLLATRNDAGIPMPSVAGWVFPNPALDKILPGPGGGPPSPDPYGQWVHVATAVVMTEYNGSVVHLAPGQNRIYLCHGGGCPGAPTTPPACATSLADAWWVRVNGTVGPVCRHSVAGYNPPGTARWRWLANDETTWTPCHGGCCQPQ